MHSASNMHSLLGVHGTQEPSTSGTHLVHPRMLRTLADKRVLIVGDLMLDVYLFGDAERISPEAPVPVVRVEEEQYYLGGAGNVARNVAALGGKATLVGCMGTDSHAERLAKLVNAENIIPAMVSLHGHPTTVKTRILARRQQMLRLDYEDSRPLEGAQLEQILDAVQYHIAGHQVVILSDYNKGLVSPAFMDGFRHILDDCSERPKVLVDPKPAHMSLYGGMLLMTPNAKETSEGANLASTQTSLSTAVSPIAYREGVLAAGRALLERSQCPHLLTTLGSDGMALFINTNEVWHVPTMAQNVFDVTGAGDTVIATLGLALAADYPLLPACVLANYAAGLVVAKVGAATATPQTLAEAIQSLPAPALTRWA